MKGNRKAKRQVDNATIKNNYSSNKNGSNNPQNFVLQRYLSAISGVTAVVLSLLLCYYFETPPSIEHTFEAANPQPSQDNDNCSTVKTTEEMKPSNEFEDYQINHLKRIQRLASEGGLPSEDVDGILKFNKGFCYTKECLIAAEEIIRLINFTTDPCTNWLEYSCRKTAYKYNKRPFYVLKKNIIKNTIDLIKNGKGLGNFLMPEAQAYYSQCLNKGPNSLQEVDSIFDLLEENFGEFPLWRGTVLGLDFDWLGMMVKVNRLMNVIPFLKMEVSQTSEATIKILAELKPDFYTDEEEFHNTLLRNLRVPIDLPGISKEIEDIIQISKLLRGVINSGGSGTKETFTLEELQQKTEDYLTLQNVKVFKLKWKHLISSFLEGTQINIGQSPTPVKIELDFELVMKVMVAVQTFIDKNQYGGSSTISNIFHLQVSAYLTSELAKGYGDYGALHKYCDETVSDAFSFALGRTYLEFYYDERKTTEVEEIFQNVKKVYLDGILNIPWMQKTTKEHLYEKIQSTSHIIAEPEWAKDSALLKDFFKSLNMRTHSSFSQNTFNHRLWYASKQRSQVWNKGLRKKMAPEYWHEAVGCSGRLFTYPIQDTLCLLPEYNQIDISAGMLQNIYFDTGAPGFSNYGSLGMVIAHEFGHHFDSNGQHFNSHGDKGDYWDGITLKHFKNWIDSLRKSYKEASRKILKGKINYQTVNEDIADNLGLQFSHLAYQEYLKTLESEGKTELKLPGLSQRFSPEQLFFLRYASSMCERRDLVEKDIRAAMKYDEIHSLGEFRASVPAQRLQAFAETFKCEFSEPTASFFT